jgi:hypothetical protein
MEQSSQWELVPGRCEFFQVHGTYGVKADFMLRCDIGSKPAANTCPPVRLWEEAASLPRAIERSKRLRWRWNLLWGVAFPPPVVGRMITAGDAKKAGDGAHSARQSDD